MTACGISVPGGDPGVKVGTKVDSSTIRDWGFPGADLRWSTR